MRISELFEIGKHFYCFSVIEQLPVELRERFTEMREMDLQVQSKFCFSIQYT